MQAGRKFKFRGKCIADGEFNGQWVYGDLLQKNGKMYIAPHANAVSVKGPIGKLLVMHEVSPDSVGQFTGLCDKNGKEIYEGDILRQVYRAEAGSYDDRISFEGHHIGSVVITASKGVCMKNPLCYSVETDETNRSNQYKGVSGYRCQVIGNIYENPVLLAAI